VRVLFSLTFHANSDDKKEMRAARRATGDAGMGTSFPTHKVAAWGQRSFAPPRKQDL
jgi:hypothetical protein